MKVIKKRLILKHRTETMEPVIYAIQIACYL